MSKVKTQKLQARFDDSTLVIGLDGTGHTTRFEGNVILPQYVTNDELASLLEGYNSIYKYITREEFKQNSNKVFIQDVEPQQQNPDDQWEFEPKDGDLWFDSKLENFKVFQTINDVGAWRVPEIQSAVEKLKEDVITLGGEIESLINLNEKGSWGSTPNDPPESGKVNFSSTSFTTSPMTVKISKLDTDGTSHTFNTAGVGTWIEFVEDDQDYCLGQITAVDNDDDDFFLTTFDVSVAKGEVVDDSSVKIRLFEAADDFDPASIRIVDIDTTPPIEPNEGALWFDNNEEDMTLRVYQQASEAWIPVAPATTIEGRVATGEALQAEIRSGLSALEAQVSSSLVEQNRIKHQPPGVKFAYQDGSSGLTEKHFLLWESGGDKRIRISSKGVDVDWLDQGINPDYTMNDGPYFSIYYMPSIASANDRVKWRQRWHGRVSRIDWHTNDILVYVSSWHAYGTLAADADYFITIGGIL